MENEDLDYVKILKAILELPFQVGRNLLYDFLSGNYSNKSITKNRLDELNNFDTLYWNKDRFNREVDRLIANGMIDSVTSSYNKFIKVLELTLKGRNEIIIPTLSDKKLSNKIDFEETEITDEDKKRFENFEDFLNGFNEEQKKGIVSEAKNILCVAGAGSGKTTVLTKRIEFLVKKKGISPSKILAITFTRKAREEMQKRLMELEINNVNVHTFNSFCENVLRQNENKIYGRKMRVLSYSDKILAINIAFGFLGLTTEEVIDRYFKSNQKKFKTQNQLFNSFVNDCFSVMDYFKLKNENPNFGKNVDAEDKQNAEMILKIIKILGEHMKTQGFRDYIDQVIDAIDFLKNNKEEIPQFEHILIDEYQDINSTQIGLIDLLNGKNLFAVGDPRQSIFGWRGSDINYVLDFDKKYPDAETIHLIRNYRSSKKIVDFMNHSIREFGLPDLVHDNEESSSVKIIDFETEEAERKFVIDNVLNSEIDRNEIFVLARTNRQLMELSREMKLLQIPHVVKTDEVRNFTEVKNGEVTLATVHAIKGLEAKHVFLIGANEQNFPCKASDHPAIEMLKQEEYDREEEERRLFYVAISRAKNILYVTYSGKKPTYFITNEMMRMGK